MNNFDYNYDTIGSSALKPRHAAASLSVVEGGRHDARRQCSVREQARRAYDWYVSADAPVCSASVIGDRERLGACLVFFAIAGMVLLGALL